MPWTVENPPSVAKNWNLSEKRRCVKAANSTLARTGKEEDAVFACIAAAGKSKQSREEFNRSLDSREILKVGTWNGITFEEDDLRNIVNAFNALRGDHEVPLKFGHNEEQDVTDGQPAIGWVSNLFLKGESLFADFINLPTLVFDAIMERRFRTVSVELLRDVEHEGQEFEWVLDAVALLGADQPAVRGLKELADLTFARSALSGGRRFEFSLDAGDTDDNDDEEDDNMSGLTQADLDRSINAAVGPLKDALSDTKKELSDAAADRDKYKREAEELKRADEDREKKAKELAVKASRKEIGDLFEAGVKDDRITPAQRDTFERTLGVDDDDRVVKLSKDDVVALIGKPKAGKTGDGKSTGARSGNSDDEGGDESPDDQLTTLTRKHMLDSGEKDFDKAGRAVLSANPKLAKAYVTMNDSD